MIYYTMIDYSIINIYTTVIPDVICKLILYYLITKKNKQN